MRGKLAFDPADYDYGPATPRIRALLALAAEIGWFEVPDVTEDHADRPCLRKPFGFSATWSAAWTSSTPAMAGDLAMRLEHSSIQGAS